MAADYGGPLERVDAGRVTVLVPCYNAARYLPEMFAGLRAQTAEGFTSLLFDDGSNDDTYHVCRAFADTFPCVKAVRRDHNVGVCGTLNEALRMVDTEFTIVFAADDVMLPTLVADALSTIDRLSSDYAAVAFPLVVGDVDARPSLDERGAPRVASVPDGVAEALPGDLLPMLVVANRFSGVAMFRTDVIRSLGYDESLRMEDWDMWCRIAVDHRIGALPRPAFIYRDTPFSLDKQLRASGQRYVDGAVLRSKWVGRSDEIDGAIADRTRTDLHVLLAAGNRASARTVLDVMGRAGLGRRFRAERLLLRVPPWVLRPALAVPQRLRNAARR